MASNSNHSNNNGDCPSVTFKVNNTTRKSSSFDFPLKKNTLETSIENESWMSDDSKVIHQSSDEHQYSFSVKQGFLGAIYLAYAKHYDLVIAPDDVWLTILFAFSDYMKHHAEDMRPVFVNHDQKKQLIINTEDSFKNQCWEDLLCKFENALGENIKKDHKDWIIPHFSTTTALTRTISQIIFMGINKQYFSYGITTLCGIPNVTLQGSLEDWNMLLDKIKRLGELGDYPDLANWSTMLTTIVSKMIDSYNGNVDVDWWNQCIHHHQWSGTDDFSGWALAFFPFKDGKWQLNSFDSIQTTHQYGQVKVGQFVTYGSVHVPVKYNEFGKMHDVMFYACSQSFKVQGDAVQTAFNYAIVELPENTITEPYDWNDTSVKKVISIKNRRHWHPLIKTKHLTIHTCDICQMERQEMFYCQQCDFDMCEMCVAFT